MKCVHARLLLAVAVVVSVGGGFTYASATAPDTAIDSHPAAATKSTSASFTFHSAPAGAAFECSLDHAAYGSCVSPQTYSSLSEGSHVFQVRATSGAGTDATPASWSWKVDTTPPVVGVPQVGLGRSLSASHVELSVLWTGHDAGSGIASYQVFRRSGKTWSAVRGLAPGQPYAYDFAPPDVQTWYIVRAIDNAGNVGAFQVSAPRLVDIVQSDSVHAATTGTWDTVSSPVFSGGSTLTSTDTDATVALSIAGAYQLGAVGDFGPNRGVADISMNTGAGQTLSLGAPTFTPRLVLAGFGGASGFRTITARVTGTFEAPSTSPRIDVDAFVVLD